MTKEKILSLIEINFFFEKLFSYNDIANINEKYLDYEGNQVAKFFEGKLNKDLTIERLLDDYPGDPSACLAFMKPEAASYFIGGFMHMSLSSDLYGQDLRFHLMSQLESYGSHENYSLTEWFKSFLKFLSVDQRNVIVEYINYVEENFFNEILVVDFDKAKSNFKI